MIKYKKDTDNIVVLTLDMSEREKNIINHEIAKTFIPVIEHLQKEKAKGKLRGVIITSSKKTFLEGGDLEYLYKSLSPAELFEYSQTLEQIFRRLESPGVPVVAAINGTALGTGFELALACHHRIAIDNPNSRLGNPEASLGLMPGNGGVIRLMWILGIEKAYRIISAGRKFRPKEALHQGIIDELAPDRTAMLEQAKNWLMQTEEGVRPWDRKGGIIPGGTANDPVIANRIRYLAAELTKTTYNNYPVPQAILNTLTEGSKVDFDTACRIQSRYFTKLLSSKESRNMVKAFWFDYNAIKSGANRPKGFGKFRPKKVGIIGAGRMGSGIAFTCLKYGMEVVIKDVSKAVADRSIEHISEELDKLVASARINPEDKPVLLQKIKTTDKSDAFEGCDIVMEAVFENKNVKINVLKEAEEYMDEFSLFATNTVSIPITELGKAAKYSANFIGLHFFSPVEETRLVEIVKGEQTSDESIARAFDFVRKLNKIPIIVKDNWGFFASRVQNTYILEGIQMLQEGYAPALIENIGLQIGMPHKALRLADALSLELVLRYEEQAAKHYGPKYIQHPAVDVLNKMIKELERKGRTKQAGFYEYESKEPLHLWKELTEHFPTSQSNPNIDELKERLLFVQVLEAVWCLQEGIVKSIPEANLGSTLGWGFPAYKGGVIQFVNDYGIEDFVAKCKVYEKEYGPRFSVPKMLLNMKKEGAVFA